MQGKILALCGTSRHNSLNHQLLQRAATGVRDAGGRLMPIRLVDFDLPLYDTDREESFGVPQAARDLQALVEEHQGFSSQHRSEFVAAPAARWREPWSGWREHRIGWDDVAGAWAVAALFLAVLLCARL